jgi:hypothetical protein
LAAVMDYLAAEEVLKLATNGARYRGDRAHIGNCTTLDRVIKNSKNNFKNPIFLQFFLCSISINWYKFHENLMIIS